MLQWILLIFIFNSFNTVFSQMRIFIVRIDNNREKPVPPTIEVPPGTNLTLRCFLANNRLTHPGFIWGRRSKDILFHNENDLNQLLEDNNKHIIDLQNESDYSGIKQFINIKYSDHGAYFCMTTRYKLSKVIHIKVRNITSSCADNKFRCESDGFCISSHYQCDGIADCRDGSDESLELCNGEPCKGKYQCNDGRCIPTTWCCDKHSDKYCTAVIRHHCCPVLPNPYDPLHWYNNQNITREITKGGGPRYLFIAVCVVSGILSFVLFLFITSKLCGFDKKPQHVRSNNGNDNAHAAPIAGCGHSECAIRRELTSENTCLYSTEEVSDPLILGSLCVTNDQPPSYAEVVNLPPCIDKTALEDLINAPPPPYSSTKKIASIQESVCCDSTLQK